jgi:hypothetical protein
MIANAMAAAFVAIGAVSATADQPKERPVSETNEASYLVPFTLDSSLASGLRVSAALGGGRRMPSSSIRDRSAS